MVDSDTTARGLLMLRPIPTLFTEDLDTTDMDWDTSDTTATMDSDMPTMARGLLMLSLRPRLILTTLDRSWIRRTPWILWPWTRIRIRQILLRQIGSLRSFSEPSTGSSTKMDCYQFEVPFTSAAVSVLPYYVSSYGKQEARES